MSTGMQASTPSGPTRGLLGVALAAAALSLGACGSSSSTSSTGTSAAARQDATSAPHKSAPGAGHRTATATGGRPDPVTNGTIVRRPINGTGGSEVNDDNPGYADSGSGSATGQIDPCELVSRAQAQAIIGHRIEAPQEAPLGPTCIYQPVGARSSVTITVEALDLATVAPDIRNRKQLSVDGHTAYCGDYGQTTTFVPVGRGRVLSITAPCGVGTRLAAIATPRVPKPHPR